MNEWKSIESAPKDGTWVLLHYERDLVPEITFWDETERKWLHDFSYSDKSPTHWMPLPESPEESWWCDKCCVEVYQLCCPHCGKTKREKS